MISPTLASSRNGRQDRGGHSPVPRSPSAATQSVFCALVYPFLAYPLETRLTGVNGQGEHAASLDAVMVKTCDAYGGFAEQVTVLMPSANCIDPNLGTSAESCIKTAEVPSLPVPLCLDEDALTRIAQDPTLMKLVSQAQVVMTPHEGELRRLIPDVFAQTTCWGSRAKKNAAKAMNCNVLFKGPDTIVACPSGDCVIVYSKPFQHAAWLATAGSGVVLSEMITGLMARGFDGFDAATQGAHLHLQCAEAIGPGLIAEHIPEALPSVLARCLSFDSEQK